MSLIAAPLIDRHVAIARHCRRFLVLRSSRYRVDALTEQRRGPYQATGLTRSTIQDMLSARGRRSPQPRRTPRRCRQLSGSFHWPGGRRRLFFPAIGLCSAHRQVTHAAVSLRRHLGGIAFSLFAADALALGCFHLPVTGTRSCIAPGRREGA